MCALRCSSNVRLSCSAYDAVATPAADDVDLMGTGARNGGGAAVGGANAGATDPDTAADSGSGGRILLAGAVGIAVLAARRSSAEGAAIGGMDGCTAGKVSGIDWDSGGRGGGDGAGAGANRLVVVLPPVAPRTT